MSQEQADLNSYFAAGLTAGFGNGNKSPSKAREYFHWCIEQIDADQCDLHRALALIDSGSGPASSSAVERIYKTMPTWGNLLSAAGADKDSPWYGIGEASLHTTALVIPELDLTYTLKSRTIIHVGYASVLVNQGRFGDAMQVISAVDSSPVPIVGLAKAYLFFKSQRWHDLISEVEDIHVPVLYKGNDEKGEGTDPLVQAAAYLFSGIGHAHLGNFVVAEDHLKRADGERYINVGAEACYYLGLIQRAKGDEEAASICFNSGLAYSRTEKLAAALADNTIKLRQTTAELIKQRTSYWDVSTEADLDEIREAQWSEKRNALLAEAEAELDRQIGMTHLKEQVRRFRAQVAWESEAARRGLKVRAKARHMAFTGPPGTGKTTIARVMAKILCGLGMIKTDKVIEVGRRDLIGQHIGDTEVKTGDVIDSALDGVLFIDEAYALGNTDSKNDFGPKALEVLLARMENERDRLVVIIAGYANEIKMLLDTNEGLNSRISRRLGFSSYSPEEIGAIAEVIAKQTDSILAPSARELIVEETRAALLVADAKGRRLLDVAGNGRYARNVIELAEEHRSERLDGSNLQALSPEEFTSLIPADVEPALRRVIDPLLGITRPDTRPSPDTFEAQGI